MDSIGREARKRDPGYTCGVCNGTGSVVKWPTEWTRFAGDIMPVADVPDDLQCHALIVVSESGTQIIPQDKWDGWELVDTDFDGLVKPRLAQLGIEGGVLITVDYHS
jgi:hypothetical protein